MSFRIRRATQYLASLALALISTTSYAATITQWTFDSVPPDGATNTGTETPVTGAGTFSLVGGITATYATGNGGGADNSGRNTATYPAQGSGDKTRGVEFAVSTVGFNAISFAFDLRHSNTSANTVVVQYSTDGTTFIDFTTFVATAGDTFFARSVDFSPVAGLNNNANAKFRVLSTFAAGGSIYVASNPASSYGGGTMRYDNVVVSGTAIGGGDVPPTVLSTNPANSATNVAVSTAISIGFSEAVDVAADGVTLVCGSPGTTVALNTLPAINVSNLVLTPASALPNSSSCTITVFASKVVDRDGAPNAMVSDVTASFTTAGVVVGDTAPTIAPTPSANTRLSLAATSPGYASGVLSDSTDPLATLGAAFTVSDAETAVGSLVVTATSSNQTVVPNANISIAGNTANRTVSIVPAAVGFATITVTVSDGSLSSNYVIEYAASAASVAPANSRFITGACDASTALAIAGNALYVANDEDQRLRLYPSGVSGFFASAFDATSSLGLTDLSGGLPREVDIEASTRIGNRIYWLGSHSNSSSGNNRPNRSRLFAADLSGSGTTATLSFVGYYAGLKTDLVAWDQANGHGLGANALGFSASTASGIIPEAPDGSGFNIEALTIAPDGSTAYIGFRAPLATAATRNRALIVPITNFASLVGASPASGPATFGTPILMDLGGRAIRSMERNAANEYLILAGPVAGATGIAPSDFRVYRWTGSAADAPVLLNIDLTSRNTGGSFEGIVEVPNPLVEGATISLLVDTGDADFYGNTIACKDLPNAEHKKARVETFTVTLPPTRIHAVQGSGTDSPLVNQTVTVEGIVTGDFQGPNQLSGFYIQEPDALKDNNENTSEGIFVFNTSTPVAVGDLVRVRGVVTEFSAGSGTLTQLAGDASVPLTITVLSSANPLPVATVVNLPVANVADLERYEGMRVRFTQTLTVTENFNLARFGELMLATNRLIQPTQTVDPNDDPASGTSSSGASNVAAVTAQQTLNARSQILLDDASNAQNPPTIPYWNTTDNTLRIGSTLTDLTGILTFGFSAYRVQPTEAPVFSFATRPATPPALSGGVKVASFNVLNYFNGDGAGGGFPTARGANTTAEFTRQRNKTIAAINGLNADVVGLMEIENDGNATTSAIADLVNGLNAQSAPGTWAFVNDPVGLSGTAGGTDQIKVAMIYKPASVSLEGAALACDNAAFSNGRTPVAQTFRSVGNGGRFSVVVNHLKSKSTSTPPTGADVDQNDGQSAYNASRRAQANALAACASQWRDTIGDKDFMLIGDFNAYAQEDPMDVLRAAGYRVLDDSGYSYVFSGQSGSLDHAVVSESFNSQVAGVGVWHINADEPRILDYNIEFKNTAGCTSNCTSPDFYTATAFRSSDHDPVIVGLNLAADPATTSLDIDGLNGCTSEVDALLVLRYLAGFRDQALIEGITLSGSAPRNTATTIAAYLASVMGLLDIDDDGVANAATDGLLFDRYIRGLIDAALVESARAPRSVGGLKPAADIKRYLDARCTIN
jgi:predicted extracellular nuclease